MKRKEARKCRECLENFEKSKEDAAATRRAEAFALPSNSAAAKLVAAVNESALEAEKVVGMKVKLGNRGGGARWRGRGRGRGK